MRTVVATEALLANERNGGTTRPPVPSPTCRVQSQCASGEQLSSALRSMAQMHVNLHMSIGEECSEDVTDTLEPLVGILARSAGRAASSALHTLMGRITVVDS